MKANLRRNISAIAIAIGLAMFVSSPSFSATPDVGGNNSISAYVGTGGLLLPDSFSGLSSLGGLLSLYPPRPPLPGGG